MNMIQLQYALLWNIEFIRRMIFSCEIHQYCQKSAKRWCNRKNNPGNRFLVLKNHSVDTLDDLLGQNMENIKITIARSAARLCAAASRLCAAAARYTVVQFLAIPYQVFWTHIQTLSTILWWNMEFFGWFQAQAKYTILRMQFQPRNTSISSKMGQKWV